MKYQIPKPRFLRHLRSSHARYRYGLVTNKFGTANKLRCLVSALRSCEEVHCDDEQLNSLLLKPLLSSRPECDYQRFSTWRLDSPFWDPLDYRKGYRGSVFLDGCRDKEVITQKNAVDLEYFNIPRKLRRDIARSFRSIEFSHSIVESADQIRSLFKGEPCAGVAIRTWVDCLERRHLFDLATFEQQLKRLHPDHTIFLTSDSPDLEAYIASRYKRRIITSSRLLDGDTHVGPARSIESHQRALREILVLAGADLLIGSYMSTFIEVAWWLSGAEKPIHVV